MKYIFIFIYFTGANVGFIKQVVNSKDDCVAITKEIHSVFAPAMKARGLENYQEILDRNTKCVPISGGSTKED